MRGLEQGIPYDWMRKLAYVVLRSLFILERCSDSARRKASSTSRASDRNRPMSRMLFRFSDYGFRLTRWIIPARTRKRLFTWLMAMAHAELSLNEAQSYAPPTESGKDLDGFNLVGHVGAELGLGEAARATLRAAKSAGIQVAGLDYGLGCAARWGEEFQFDFNDIQQFAVNLFHLNADQLYAAYHFLGKEFFAGRYNIDYCLWEQTPFPDEWLAGLELVEEIWTPSSFCQEVIAQKVAKPVFCIPLNVEPKVDTTIDRQALGLPGTGFIFLAMADFLSTPERKNPLGCLEAYLRGFGTGVGDVYFVLKIMNSHLRPDVMREIENYIKRGPSIILVDGVLARLEVNALINCCDCFVSLHRAEGFGLPIAESMYLGKPAIATAWSGNMDFMNQDNSFPVQYMLKELDRDAGPYRKGYRWAEPDLDHAAEMMQRVARDPAYGDFIGKRGQERICDCFSARAVGELLRQHLMRIRVLFG